MKHSLLAETKRGAEIAITVDFFTEDNEVVIETITDEDGNEYEETRFPKSQRDMIYDACREFAANEPRNANEAYQIYLAENL